jgi:hypothetical protein
MMKFLKSLFGTKAPVKRERNDFSDFFNNATKEEKEELINEVLKEAIEEQRKVMAEYEKAIKTT